METIERRGGLCALTRTDTMEMALMPIRKLKVFLNENNIRFPDYVRLVEPVQLHFSKMHYA